MRRAPTRLGYVSALLVALAVAGLLVVLVADGPQWSHVVSLLLLAAGAVLMWLDQAGARHRP